MNKFYIMLKDIRKSNKLSQQQLAKDLGVRQSTIAQWETNARSPNLDMLISIADYFDVSTDYLLGRDNDTLIK